MVADQHQLAEAELEGDEGLGLHALARLVHDADGDRSKK